MKTIKRVVLNDATELTNDEMKMVFGGSSVSGSGSSKSGCSVSCVSSSSVSIDNCPGDCLASGNSVACFYPDDNGDGIREFERIYCNGDVEIGKIYDL